tara:strand:- start:2741 stop:4675 length:1935 start_codon:yes stop_codon:yes gene_type:complete
MAVNEKRLNITEFDFDDVKDNLKVFLKNQSEFKDYDFEGSGMSILLDILAYNTHYLGFNANMLANEMFLDSASLRSSVVSHAKTLGYEVTSARSPIATVNVALSTTDSSKTMPAGTAFSTTVDDVSYQFVTIADSTASGAGGVVTFNNTKIYEGTYITSKYLVDTSDVAQRFLLPDSRVDTSTLKVQVQNSASDSTVTTYTKATDISQISSTSSVYFLQEVENGRHEVYFGDGNVSKALSDGNIVILNYVVTNKTASNGASSFSAPSTIDGVSDITVTTVSNAGGGAEPESLASIKLQAPLDYASQGRAVTTDDYVTYTKKLFANTQAVSVWGGEDGGFDPATGITSVPEYGKVFISIRSTTGQNLTDTEKTQLVNDFGKFKVTSITPVIVNPETTFIILNITFQYDSNVTTKTQSDLETLINTTISNYNSDNLQDFNRPFRHSQLTGLIDDTDNSILSNVTTVTLAKFVTPDTTKETAYTLSFDNAFFHPHDGHNSEAGGIIASTGFFIDGNTTREYFFDDDGNGNLRIYYLVAGVRTYFDALAGTVDYDNGEIKINPVKITSVSDVDEATSTRFRLTVLPNSNDIVPVRNQLLELDLTNITVSGTVDATATTGKGYTVTTTATTTQTTTTTTASTTPTTSGY